VESRSARKLQNATPKERQLFLEAVFQHYQQQNLSERLQKIRDETNKEWTTELYEEYERCDFQHINGMLAAEKQISKTKNKPWSPIFGAAISKKAFWKIALSLRLTYKRPSTEYLTWAKSLGIEDFQALSLQTIKQKLRESQRDLRELKKQADKLREEHLRDLISSAEENEEDANYQLRLQAIKRAHERRTQYRKIRQILKPQQAGGLSYILVPKDFSPEQYPYNPDMVTDWEPIHDPEMLQDLIQQRNILHFGQAHGTPFTMEPLNKIDWAGQSPEACEVLQGSIPLEFLSENHNVNKIISYIANREQLEEIDTHMTPQQISQGFKKWREDTATWPSGCHLGLRRIPAFITSTKESEEI
jgi:hypothetical protein